MPEPTDLQRVAQYVKSDKTAPSVVYNAACRILDEGCRADKAETAIDDALWRMHQLRSWAYRETTGDVMHNVLAVITNVWDCLDPERTRWVGPRTPERGAEINGDERTPQTLGTGEGHEAGEAQGVAQ